MKGKRYTEEQIIGILKEHEAGMPAQEVIRSGDAFRIRTYGGGSGSMGGPNIWLDDLVWGPVDDLVRDNCTAN